MVFVAAGGVLRAGFHGGSGAIGSRVMGSGAIGVFFEVRLMAGEGSGYMCGRDGREESDGWREESGESGER
jgi:hypothetical protein